MYKIIEPSHGYVDFFGKLIKADVYNEMYIVLFTILMCSAVLMKNSPVLRILTIISIGIMLLLF